MLEPSRLSLFSKKLIFSVFVFKFFFYSFRDYFFRVIQSFDSMRDIFETLEGPFFAFRENLPHQFLAHTWEKRFVEEIHEPWLLLFDYHFKRVRQLHFRAMCELFVAHSPFDVINLAPLLLLLAYIKAVISLRNEAFKGYEFEECKVALTNDVHNWSLLINWMGIVRVSVR